MVKIAIVNTHPQSKFNGSKQYIQDFDGNPQTWASEEQAQAEIECFNKTNGAYVPDGAPTNFEYVIEPA
tara:strand:- start:43 stop:249 length:207 start_codon:yes stop_codon:yes gene_type:complete